MLASFQHPASNSSTQQSSMTMHGVFIQIIYDGVICWCQHAKVANPASICSARCSPYGSMCKSFQQDEPVKTACNVSSAAHIAYASRCCQLHDGRLPPPAHICCAKQLTRRAWQLLHALLAVHSNRCTTAETPDLPAHEVFAAVAGICSAAATYKQRVSAPAAKLQWMHSSRDTTCTC
jgi:hypothetical protein